MRGALPWLLSGAMVSLVACGTSDAPGTNPNAPVNGGGQGTGGQQTSVAGNGQQGGTANNAGSGNGGQVNPGGGSAGLGGGPTMLDPCADCVEFGLDTRPSNTTCLAGDAPPTAYEFSPIWSDVNLGTVLKIVPSPDGVTMYAAEKSGVIHSIPKDPNATQAQSHVFGDLTTLTRSDAESGVLSMALHPDFENNGYVYVTYSLAADHSTRVARFTSTDGGQTLDLASEATVLQLTQLRGTHHGGDLAFGPDGFLYVSLGDNNSGDDHDDFTAADRSKLYGALLRLDVNVPGDGYNIPADNPYADGTAGAPEVFAKGLRNPWRFSFDSETNDIWLGDPGEEAGGIVGDDGQADPFERVELIVSGGFYGWPFYQGMRCFHDCTSPAMGTTFGADERMAAEYEYSHNGGPAALVGGFVYRGSAIPGLYGKYLFGDYETNESWIYDPATKQTESLGFPGAIVAFAQDGDGELYVSLEGGDIRRLVDSNAGAGGFPEMISQTGCFKPDAPTTVVDGAIPFTVAVPFWSDGAEKERFVALPDGQTIEVAADGDFTLPVGAVTIKNFRWQGQLFETRFFVRHNDGSYYGYSYEWNDAQTEATLVPAEGKDRSLPGLEWSYPSTANCFTCHSDAAGRSLGLEVRQLNSVGTYGALRANQFNTLNHIGVLSGNVAALDAFVPATIADVDLDFRARSYLAVNCSNCHRPGGPGRGAMDARFDTPFADMGVCDHPPEHGDFMGAGTGLLVPGNHMASVMWLRMSQRQDNFMPPIASKIADSTGADMLATWIDGHAACTP
jgi:uncharacterized repeat protein (TIGR03806 family)